MFFKEAYNNDVFACNDVTPPSCPLLLEGVRNGLLKRCSVLFTVQNGALRIVRLIALTEIGVYLTPIEKKRGVNSHPIAHFVNTSPLGDKRGRYAVVSAKDGKQ